jgi:hypothetical protein
VTVEGEYPSYGRGFANADAALIGQGKSVQFRTVLTEHYGFREQRKHKLDPITDIIRTMHVTAFGLHNLEATNPWGVKRENQAEEKVRLPAKKLSPQVWRTSRCFHAATAG